ncbi:beta-ketoacyl synthase N-terminal-like domain-containing protein [Kitasatospora sp. NPDC006697]|uniref:beta-ketoacyl synthase N-terminal-like domain-containing protein n=1 Tax=Kitasatospora sp. NPDC006697 TaxID=3364020 RepID=UPI00367F7CE2
MPELPAPAGRPVAVTALDAVTACGRGTAALAGAVFDGTAGFVPVDRFDVSARRTKVAAQLPGDPDLAAELAAVVAGATAAAGLEGELLAGTPLFFAGTHDRAAARPDGADRTDLRAGALAARLAAATGLSGALRAYTTACVAASTAVADAAALISAGRLERAVVAAGYFLEADRFTLFDSARSLASDGRLRPFSAGRQGMLLGDAAVAVVLEAESAAADRGREPLARIAGWGRAGDAYHVSQPHPEGVGLARAVATALRRAGLTAEDLDYVNAHGSGTTASDTAESAGLHRALGAETAARVPVSSTKSVHGHTLEASGLVELAVSVLALTQGRLPVNGGGYEPDPDCPLTVVDRPRSAPLRHVLTLNAAFGGANTALVVSR